jgi:microcystin-dependent protein
VPANLTSLSGALSTNGGVAYVGNEAFVNAACSYHNIGDIILSVNGYGQGALPADGRLLPIAQNTALFSLLGTNFGGNGTSNFGLPDLRSFAPQGLQYSICVEGIFPPRI